MVDGRNKNCLPPAANYQLPSSLKALGMFFQPSKTKNLSRRIISGVILIVLGVSLIKIVKMTQWASVISSAPGKQKGASNARVKLIEFSDFQCPSCKNALGIIKDLMDLYPNDLKVIFKHYPLDNVHSYARLAAISAECAKEQDKFWLYHDTLYDKQEAWTASSTTVDAETFMKHYAQTLDLNTVQFESCLKSPKARNFVDADIAEGDARSVDGTPTFFLENHLIAGATQLRREGARLIEVELKK